MRPISSLLIALFCWVGYVSPADVLSVQDGDTYSALVAVWPGMAEPGIEIKKQPVNKHPIRIPDRIRILGVYTPEEGKPGYKEAKIFLEEWLLKGKHTVKVCGGRDRGNRALGEVTREGDNVAEAIIRAGHGVKR